MAASRGEHARCPEGSLINNRYKVVRECGCGNFSKVFRCVDTQSPTKSTVAVKLLKREYATDAKFENDMLKHINGHDTRDEHKVLKMKDFFVWNRHPCFVFPLKGPALRSRKLSVPRGHVSRKEFVAFAHQMCSALSFLHHDLRMIHTDLKPENILLDADAESGLGSGWTIVDFGSASFYKPGKLDSDLISTRPYRAPEVVLGNPWCYRADVWSMACILFEVFTGTRMFEVHDDGAHMQQFMQRLGKMPESLTHRAKHSRKYFDANGNLLSSGGGGARAGGHSSAAASGGVKAISEVLADEPALLDLLTGMFQFDPSKRLTARDALQHPFFEGFASSAVTAMKAPSLGRHHDAAAAPATEMDADELRFAKAAAAYAAAAAAASTSTTTTTAVAAAPPVAAAPAAPVVSVTSRTGAPMPTRSPVMTSASAATTAQVLAERNMAKENALHGLHGAMDRLKLRNLQSAVSSAARSSSSSAAGAAAASAAAPSSGRAPMSQLPPAGRPTPRYAMPTSSRPW